MTRDDSKVKQNKKIKDCLKTADYKLQILSNRTSVGTIFGKKLLNCQSINSLIDILHTFILIILSMVS